MIEIVYIVLGLYIALKSINIYSFHPKALVRIVENKFGLLCVVLATGIVAQYNLNIALLVSIIIIITSFDVILMNQKYV